MELPKGPSHPCCNSRSSPTYPSPLERKQESPANIQRTPLPPPSSRGGILSLRVRERIPGVSVASQEEALPQEVREVPQSRATFPESTRCLSPFQGNLFSLHCLDFQAEDRLTPRWHVGQPCVTASWEMLVGKPRGKAPDPLIHAK